MSSIRRFAISIFVGLLARILVFAATVLGPGTAYALEITNAFNSNRNFGPSVLGPGGDSLVFGAESITPSGFPTTATATQGGTTVPLPFSGDPIFPNHYVATLPFAPSLTGAWSITATRGADSAGPVLSNIIPGAESIPLVQNLTVTGTGASPTLNWTVPDVTGLGVNTNLVSVVQNLAGVVTTINQYNLNGVHSSFTIPGGVLSPGANYMFQVTLGNFVPSLGLINDSETYTRGLYTPISGPGISQYTWSGTCTVDCTGLAGLNLTLQNYVPGIPLSESNLVSLTYVSDFLGTQTFLPASNVTLTGSLLGQGNFPAQFDLVDPNLIVGPHQGFEFRTFTDGSWCVGPIGTLVCNDAGNDEIWTNPAGTTPEPSTWLLLGSGLAGLALWRRKKAA